MEKMIGKTATKVENGDTVLTFKFTDGTSIRFFHNQDCCESVRIEEVIGNLDDLVGAPIVMAQEESGDTPSDYEFEYQPDSYTWTFYKFATVKGYVTVRWLGTSNGYYSESVHHCWYDANGKATEGSHW